MNRANSSSKSYLLSFTAASLSLNESVRITELYLKHNDWIEARKILHQDNLLQSRTNSRTIRVSQELIKRLKRLNTHQLELLVEGNLLEKKYVLWFSVCKTYKFIEEFSTEVLHEKYLSRNLKITDLDYDAFFNRKAEWNEKLQNITDLTRRKIRQVTFLMMKKAELINSDHEILRAMMSKRLIEVLSPDSPMSFKIFPVESI